MAIYFTSKLFMRPYHDFASTVELLATLLQLALNPSLPMFQALSGLMTLLLLSPKAGIMFSTVWVLKEALL
jgi:hypothetical protein